MSQFWNELPRTVQVGLAGGVPGLIMAAEARSTGWSGLASLAWGGLAGFSGVTLAGLATGNNYGPWTEYAGELDTFVLAHPWIAGIGGATGLFAGLVIGGLIDDEIAIEVLPVAVLAAAKKNSPIATDVTDVTIGVFASYAALSTFLGINAGLGFLYTGQAGACAFERVSDELRCLTGDKGACSRLKQECEFGAGAPLFPED